ncbi:MAG: DUF423 domain-containing protein [Chitinophagales bacterium]
MQKGLLITASLSGLLAVILGAFGAHGLKPMVSGYQLGIWEKAVQYQFYHSFALLICVLLMNQRYSVCLRNASFCFIAGIFSFSGSLYLLATNDMNHIPTLILGPITPLGGLFFMAGWLQMMLSAWKKS